MNFLSSDVTLELRSVTEELLLNPSIRVLIITGSGEKIFIFEANIKELADLNKDSAIKLVSLGKEVRLLLEQVFKQWLWMCC